MFIQLETGISRTRDLVRSQLEKQPWIILLILTALSFLVFTKFSIDRYLGFQTNFFDLGLDTNSIWRTLNGYDSWLTLMLPSTPGHINHISPILGLAAMIYAVVPDPRTLLVLQAGVVAGASIPLYLLAVRETRNQFVAITISGLYLLNPALHGIVRYDFHPEAFIPLFVFLVYYSYGRQGAWLFYASTGLLLATIEYSAILGLGIAMSLWVARKRLDRRILTVLMSSLGLLAVILLSTVGRAFQIVNWPSNWLAVQFLGNSSSQTGSYTAWFTTFLSNPSILAYSVGYDLFTKIIYAVVIAAPFWFAALRYSARMIPAAPWLVVVLTSSKFSFTNINFQYTAFVIPFIYLAAIPFLYRIIKSRRLVLSLVAVALCIMILYSSLSPLGQKWPQPNPLASTVANIANSLPQNATVLTQSDLFPQLSNRAYVTLNYSSPEPPQYILVNTQSVWYNWTSPALGYPLSPHQQLEHFTQEYSYRLVYIDQGLKLYELQRHL